MLFRDKKRDNIITCPHCGEEYLPAEIFIPSVFFGKPENIDKTEFGEIEVFDGTTMCTTEEFTCDKCGKKFYVSTEIKFNSSAKKCDFIDESYVSKIRPDKVSLFEVDEEDIGE